MEDIIGKLKYLINKGKSLDTIASSLGISENEVIGLVMKLKEEGYLYDYINGNVTKIKPSIEKGSIEIASKSDKGVSSLHIVGICSKGTLKVNDLTMCTR